MGVGRMLIVGRYRLVEPVGNGGTGRVWFGRDERLNRDVAVKEFVLPGWINPDERDQLRTRALREARSAARLTHPNVVRVYDVMCADGLPWIVMEYVPSRSLQQVLSTDGPLAPPAVAQIGLRMLNALAAAHAAGILHRDVKPHNILIGAAGRVVLTDFGLARLVDDSEVTRSGLIVGSPQYVSPERARDATFTPASDLWSLGATLYAAVEGRAPYTRGSSMATLHALATESPDPMRLAGPLAPVIAGLLRREPAERLTVAEAAEELKRVLLVARTAPPRQRVSRRDAPVLAGVLVGRGVEPSTEPGGGRRRLALRHRAPERPEPDGRPEPNRRSDYTGRPDPNRRSDDTGRSDHAGRSPAARPLPVPRTPRPDRGTPSTRAATATSSPARSDRGTRSRPGAPGAGSRASLPDSRASLPGSRASLAGSPPALASGSSASAARRRLWRSRWFVVGAIAVSVLAAGVLVVARVAADQPATGRPAATLAAASGSPSAAGGSPAAGSGSPAGRASGGVGGFTPQACAQTVTADVPRIPRPGAARIADNGLALPAGWSYHRDDAGFGVAVPDGWSYRRIGSLVCFRDPDGRRVLSVDVARPAAANPVRACRREAARLVAARAVPGYRELGIIPVSYFADAVDWEYRYEDAGGAAVHANVRWVVTGRRAFALGWVARHVDWRANLANLDLILSSFQPAPPRRSY